jgi:hypothetical protein
MKQYFRGALMAAVAATMLASASQSSAIERYVTTILPSGPGGAVAQGIYSCNPGGGLLGVVGEVHNDGEVYAAFWLRTQNGWRMRRLTPQGIQSTANAVVCVHRQTTKGLTHHPLVLGSQTGMDGRTVAVGFDIDAAPNGDLHMALRMLDGPGSEATDAYMDYSDDVCVIVGTRKMLDGRSIARLYSLDVTTGNAMRMSLPTAPDQNAEADAVAQLPNGELRIVGCREQEGSGVEMGCEWRGTPATGFTSQTLPHADGILTHHVYGMSESGNYAVGAQFFADGSVRPVGWATFPSSLADFGLVDLNPSLRPASVFDSRLSSVNSRGRAVGYDLGDTGTHEVGYIMDLRRSVEDQRAILFSSIVSPRDHASGLPTGLRAIGEDGTICGQITGDFNNDGIPDLAAFVAIPDHRYQMPDLLTMIDGSLDADIIWHEFATYWDDDQSIRALTKEGAGTLILDSSFTVDQDLDQPDMVSVISSLQGKPSQQKPQMLCIYNFPAGRWTFVGTETLRGGNDQANRYALPTDLKPHISLTGEMRFRLVWGDGGVPPAEGGFGVSVNAITLRSR